MKLDRKRLLANDRKDALYYVSKLFAPGETSAYCENLPHDNFLSPVSTGIVLMNCVFFSTAILLHRYLPLLLVVLLAALFLFTAYHATIRLFCRCCLIVTQYAVYLFLPSPRKRVYRMTFSEMKSVRVCRRWFFPSKTRYYFVKNRLTLCNSPRWKVIRFKRTKDVSKLNFVDYQFFHCYSPMFLQAVSDQTKLADVLIEMKKVSRAAFSVECRI